MPYEWTETETSAKLTLWPHQSMTAPGFTWFIGATAAMLCLPLFAVLGSPILWVLLIFFLITIAAVWRAITANQSARRISEELLLSTASLVVSHRPARGETLNWQANPHWVTISLRHDGPVENYLTLRGGGREVELGRFLTPEERQSVHDDLQTRLRNTR